MGSLFEEGVSWFVKLMEGSTHPSDHVELYSGALQITKSSALSIKSDSVDIKVSFEPVSQAYSIISHPNIPKDAIKVIVVQKGNTCEISVVEDSKKLKNHNAEVVFRMDPSVKTLSLTSNTGDISISGCRAEETSIFTECGDILVNNHITPCKAETSTKNGDITKIGFISEHSKNKLMCKSINGDILLSHAEE